MDRTPHRYFRGTVEIACIKNFREHLLALIGDAKLIKNRETKIGTGSENFSHPMLQLLISLYVTYLLLYNPAEGILFHSKVRGECKRT